MKKSAQKSTQRPAKKSVEPVIAERRLTRANVSPKLREVRVVLGKPVKSGSKMAYCCPVQIVGLGDDKIRPIYGLDSMQALQLALRFVSEYLSSCRDSLRWVGNKDIGF